MHFTTQWICICERRTPAERHRDNPISKLMRNTNWSVPECDTCAHNTFFYVNVNRTGMASDGPHTPLCVNNEFFSGNCQCAVATALGNYFRKFIYFNRRSVWLNYWCMMGILRDTHGHHKPIAKQFAKFIFGDRKIRLFSFVSRRRSHLISAWIWICMSLDMVACDGTVTRLLFVLIYFGNKNLFIWIVNVQ